MTVEVHGPTVWHVLARGRTGRDFSTGAVELVLGGPGASVARQLNLLGRSARLHTIIGGDDLGTLARLELARAGVLLAPYAIGGRSPRVLADVLSNGEPQIIADVDETVAPTPPMSASWRIDQLTYLTGFPDFYPVADVLANHGKRVVIDVGFKPFLSEPHLLRSHLERLAPVLGTVIFSGADMSARVRQSHAELALTLGAEVVVITRGADGVDVIDSDGAVHLDSTPANAVDTLGAGDSFTGGYLAGRDQGLDHHSAARLGQRIAETKVSLFGRLPHIDDFPSGLFKASV